MARYLVITPDADAAGVSALIGFPIATALYTTSDPQPRSITHYWAGIVTNQQQTDLIETPVSGARDSFPDSYFEVYNPRTQPTYPTDRRIALGLTTFSVDPDPP